MKPLWALVLALAAGASLVLSFRRQKNFLLSFFAFLFAASFLTLPDWFALEDHLFLLGQGLSVWAAVFFVLAGLVFLFRESVTKEEKVIVEAAPLAEFLASLKEFLVHPYTLVEVFNLSLREMGRLWGLPAGAIFVYNPSTDELLLAASVGLSREQEKRWERLRVKEELFSRAAKTGMGLVMGDLAHSRKSWAGLAPFTNFGSLVSIPLTGRERVLGLLVLLSEKPYRFTRAEEIELAPAGLALGMFSDGVRILRESRKRADEAAFYRQDLEKTLFSFASLSKGDAGHTILDAAAGRLPYQLGLILSKQGERWEVVSSSYEPVVGEIVRGTLSETITEGCQTSEVKKLSDLRFDGLTAPPFGPEGLRPDGSGVEGEKLPNPLGAHSELPPISKALLVPLFEDNQSVGALFFGFENDFKAGDYELAHLAGLAGVAALLISHPGKTAPAENWVAALQTLSAVKSEEELRSFLNFALATFFQFDTGFLFGVEDGTLRLSKNWGTTPSSSFELDLTEGVWGKVASDKAPVLLSREAAGELMGNLSRAAFDHLSKATGGVGYPVSQMAAPLAGPNGVWGVVSLERYRQAFIPADFEKFSALAELVSLKLAALGNLGVPDGVEIGNELNNDLTAILGNLELISNELPEGSPLRQKLEELGGLTQKAGEKVGQLARSLASLSGARKDINQLIDEVAAEEKENLETDLSPLPQVKVDPLSLKTFLLEVIQELMAKGESKALSLKTDTDNQFVYIRLLSKKEEKQKVENLSGDETELGKALASQTFGQIFRSDFSRLEESLSPSDLTWITEAGGQVSLVEDQERGRSLTLRFPISKSSRKGWKKSLKILAIDDQAIIRDLLVNMFGSAGHEVTTAERGEEGIAKFKIQRFDLVVTDLSMPDLSGWEVAREVKKMRPEVPVILITGWGQNLDDEKLKEAGVDRVVTKPFRIEQLMKTVEELLSKAVSR